MPRQNQERFRFTPGFNYDLIPEIVEEMTDDYIATLTKKQRFEVLKIKKVIEERKKVVAKAEEMRLKKMEKERKKQEGLEKKRIQEERRLERQKLEIEAKRKEREKIECAKIKLAADIITNDKFNGSGDSCPNKDIRGATTKFPKKIHFKSRLKDCLIDPKFLTHLTLLDYIQFVSQIENKSKREFDKLLLECGYSHKTERDPCEVLLNLLLKVSAPIDKLEALKEELKDLREALDAGMADSLSQYVEYIINNGTDEHCFFYNLAFMMFMDDQDTKYLLGFADFRVSEKGSHQQIDIIANNVQKFMIEMRIPWRDTSIVDTIAAIEEDSGRIKRLRAYMLKDKNISNKTSASQAMRHWTIKVMAEEHEIQVWRPLINRKTKRLIDFLELLRSGGLKDAKGVFKL